MNDFDHPFDPAHEVVFSKCAYQAADNYRCGSRELFYYLLHLGEHYDVLPLAYHGIKDALRGVDQRYLADRGQETGAAGQEWLSTEPFADAFTEGLEPADTRLCLLQFAPVLLTEPCWLENITQAATSDTQIAADCLRAHIRLTQAQPNAGDRYRGLLLQSDIRLPALCSWEFAHHGEIDAAMYEFAALQLALAQFPRVFLPEILGFTLAFCRMSALPETLCAVAENEAKSAIDNFIALRKRIAEAQIPILKKTIADYLDTFPAQAEILRQRIQAGLLLYRQGFERCWLSVLQRQRASQSARALLLEMLRNKAPFAAGHHARIQLQGKSLDSWFAASPFDGESFLTALKQSAYIDLEQPRASPLFKLFEFNGPMFGVFTEQDIQLFENWLLDERGGSTKQTIAAETIPPAMPGNNVATSPKNTAPGAADSRAFSAAQDLSHPRITLPVLDRYAAATRYETLSNRELYYYLLNAELYPEILPAAKRKAQTVLRAARLLQRPPFKHYDHQRFETYLTSIYAREMRQFRPLEGAPRFSAATYRWGIEQFAPAILTDGCWLQHTIRLNYYSNRDIGKILYRIFCDEAGYGKLEQNHPVIYRRLLESLDIHLPPLQSKKFIEHPGFIGSAFDLPVYMMSIAAFPNAFLPELLGLNLAIELSGLGRLYMSLAEGLEYWGIDAGIVKVHISADNFASGHAAMAKQVVQAYLDEILACCGDAERQQHWRRIHSGYCSLTTASLRFFAALVCRHLLKKTGMG